MNFLSLYKRKILYKLKKKINIDNLSLNFKSLEENFSYFGTDKANIWNNGKLKGHGFSEYYEKHLNYLKNKKINILEIGSYSGASAASFSKYFPNANIFCLDVNISKFKFCSKNIKVFDLDVSVNNSKEKFLKQSKIDTQNTCFDIIIDDGSHILSDILKCFNNYFTLIKPGGFYIIEDYKHPNYYNHLNDVEDILVDDLIKKIINKEHFKSNFFNQLNQDNIFKKIKNIDTYKGNLKDSNIVFFEMN